MTTPTPNPAATTAAGTLPGGFDPSQMDPQMMSQMMGALQRLPRGQLQRLQALMQKAMAGKDVTKEAQDFEKLLPPELRQMAAGFMAQQGMGTSRSSDMTSAAQGGARPQMSESDAKKIVQEAVASGKLSAEEAAKLLGDGGGATPDRSPGLWDRLRGKKA